MPKAFKYPPRKDWKRNPYYAHLSALHARAATASSPPSAPSAALPPSTFTTSLSFRPKPAENTAKQRISNDVEMTDAPEAEAAPRGSKEKQEQGTKATLKSLQGKKKELEAKLERSSKYLPGGPLANHKHAPRNRRYHAEFLKAQNEVVQELERQEQGSLPEIPAETPAVDLGVRLEHVIKILKEYDGRAIISAATITSARDRMKVRLRALEDEMDGGEFGEEQRARLRNLQAYSRGLTLLNHAWWYMDGRNYGEEWREEEDQKVAGKGPDAVKKRTETGIVLATIERFFGSR